MLLCVLFSLHICEKKIEMCKMRIIPQSQTCIKIDLFLRICEFHFATLAMRYVSFLQLNSNSIWNVNIIHINPIYIYPRLHVGSMPEKKWMWCVLGAILHYCIIPSIGFERSRVGTELVSGYECCIYILCLLVLSLSMIVWLGPTVVGGK